MPNRFFFWNTEILQCYRLFHHESTKFHFCQFEINNIIISILWPYTAAIQALKRKKRFMQQLQQIDGTLSTMEMQREALEDANQNTATITTMKKAAETLKKAHQNLYVHTFVV